MAIAGELPLSTGDDEARIRPGRNVHGDGVNTLVDLYRNHQQRIYRYCLSLLRNPDDAEDATQETFTRAAPFLPNLPGDLSAYLTTVARNICCDVVRARARRVVPIDNVPLTDRRVGPERQNVDWDVVRRMWRQLSPSERLLFAYTFAGYKYEEIASRTGMSRPSVSVGLTRARRRLRDLAAATGTLGLLPLAVRRLLARLGRRASTALQPSQAAVVAAAEQVGAITVGLLTGLVAVSGTAAVAAPAMTAVAAHHPGAAPMSPAAGRVANLSGSAASAAQAQAHPAGPGAGSSPKPLPTTPGLGTGITSDLPGGDATVPTSAPTGMAASPDFPTDHTVFLWGLGQCPTAEPSSCDVLFRSTDAGATWSRLAYLTYGSGSVLLPPSYPVDHRFLVLTPKVELTEYDDTVKATWTVPGIQSAAIAPWSTPGDIQVAALSVAGTVGFYQAGGSTAPQPGPMLPGGFQPQFISYGTPGQLVVSGEVPGIGTHAITVCPMTGTCAPLVQLAGNGGSGVQLMASPQVSTDHVVLAVEDFDVYVSQDGGTTFHQVFVAPGGGHIVAATVGQGPTGPRIVASYIGGVVQNRPRVVVSDNAGASFTDITGSFDAVNNVLGVAACADGTILTGLTGYVADTSGFALRQTTGNGTWIKPS